MCFVILRDLPFFWPFCEAYTRTDKMKFAEILGLIFFRIEYV